MFEQSPHRPLRRNGSHAAKWGHVSPARASGPRLLLADRDSDRLALLGAELDGDVGAVVASTTHGHHAVELARLLSPEVAVIGWDLAAPGIGGAVVAQLIRATVPHVSVVLLVPATHLASIAHLRASGVLACDAETSTTDTLRRAILHASAARSSEQVR